MPAPTAIFTASEARVFDKGQLASVADYPDATITAAEVDIRTEFTAVLGFYPIPTSTVEYADGDGTPELLLTYPEVTAVSAVSYIDTVGAATAFTAAELADLIIYPQGKLRRRGGSAFTAGYRNYAVTYTSGLATVPGDLKRAALWVCERRLVASDVPVEAETGNWEGINWAATVDPSRNRWYGNHRVDGVLARYRRVLPGVA